MFLDKIVPTMLHASTCYTTTLYQTAMVLMMFQKPLAFQGGGMMNAMGKGGKGGGAKGPLPLESIGFVASCPQQHVGSCFT